MTPHKQAVDRNTGVITSQRMICVYTVTNRLDGCVYIGQTKNTYQRWIMHRYEGRQLRQRRRKISPLYLAMNEHGESAFEFSPIEWCKSEDDADKAEAYWIDWYQSRDPARGYNVSTGGAGSRGHVQTDEKRALTSAIFKGKSQSAELVARRVAARLGVDVEEFIAHRAAGEHYCTGCGIRDPHWSTTRGCCAVEAYRRRKRAA